MRSSNRRTMVFSILAAAALGPARAALGAPGRDELVIWGPPAGPSITLVHAIENGMLRPIADRVKFKAWRNPDELRAGLTSKTMDVFVLPTQVAANLHNRGLGVHLLNVMTNGLLYVVSADEAITSVPGLKGKTIAVPFRNDTPDILFKRLLALYELSPGADLTLQFTGTPIEAIQLLAAGRVDTALVPEPAASAAIIRTRLSGQSVSRVIDVQQAWAEATGTSPVLPQAGLGVSQRFLEGGDADIQALQVALAEAAAAVNADPARAASQAAAILGMPWPVLEQSIPHSNLVATPAREARPALEAMFGVMAEADTKIIGGSMPPPSFYL